MNPRKQMCGPLCQPQRQTSAHHRDKGRTTNRKKEKLDKNIDIKSLKKFEE